MYEGDSFYTLTLLGRVGLVILSCVLALVLLWLAAKVMRWLPLAARIVLALLLCYGFVWLSPQIYYTYYMTLFEGLPWQVVVKNPPPIKTLWDHMSFQGPTNMSAHSQGALGWALIVLAFFTRRGAKAVEPDDLV